MVCNVGFAKDLTGTKLLCSAFKNSERGDPRDQKFLGFEFISDKEAKRYKVDGFYFIDEVFYEYKVSIDKIDFYSKKKGLGSDSHYSLDRAELFIYRWGCEILDDSINLKELMEKKMWMYWLKSTFIPTSRRRSICITDYILLKEVEYLTKLY